MRRAHRGWTAGRHGHDCLSACVYRGGADCRSTRVAARPRGWVIRYGTRFPVVRDRTVDRSNISYTHNKRHSTIFLVYAVTRQAIQTTTAQAACEEGVMERDAVAHAAGRLDVRIDHADQRAAPEAVVGAACLAQTIHHDIHGSGGVCLESLFAALRRLLSANGLELAHENGR